VCRAAVLILVSAIAFADARTDALYQASRQGDLVQVESLLAQGVSPQIAEVTGNTPLHAAALQGHREIAQSLLKAGAEVDARHKSDRATPLHYAVTGGHVEMMELLLDHGADASASYGDNLTALHLAAGRGFTRATLLLLGKNAPVNVRSDNGATPLEDAIRRGIWDVVRLLVDAGADTKTANPKTGQTPLHVAAGLNFPEIAGLLLDHEAQLTAPDRNGYTALEVALQYQRRETIDLLLDRGSSFDIDGALKNSVLRGQIQMLRLLIDRVKPDLASALMSDAAVKGHPEIVSFLLEHGAPVNGPNAEGAAPLHDAALGGSKGVAITLLKHGADLHARDRDNQATPLHVAASWGRREMVELLLAAGADPAARDKNGKTPLDLAISNQQIEIAALLRKNVR
jgi:ankyrin repeat protein